MLMSHVINVFSISFLISEIKGKKKDTYTSKVWGEIAMYISKFLLNNTRVSFF